MITFTLVFILGVILVCIGVKISDTCDYEIIPAITGTVGIVLTVTGLVCLIAGEINQTLTQTETCGACAVKEVEYCETCGNIIIEEETP